MWMEMVKLIMVITPSKTLEICSELATRCHNFLLVLTSMPTGGTLMSLLLDKGLQNNTGIRQVPCIGLLSTDRMYLLSGKTYWIKCGTQNIQMIPKEFIRKDKERIMVLIQGVCRLILMTIT